MSAPGILAIWQDCVAGREAEFEHWFQSEHLAERLGVPGFWLGRRYEAIESRHRFFTCYETETPEALTSDAYLARLNDPTPLTGAIMSSVMTKMSRTICRVELSAGAFRGGCAFTAKLAGEDPDAVQRLIAALADKPGIARAEYWTSVEKPDLAATGEEKLRGGDEKIAACLFVEALRETDARDAANAAAGALGAAIAETGLFRLLCTLG